MEPRILYLSSTLDEAKGWGRYAAGFIAQSRRHFGNDRVRVAGPEQIRSAADTPFKPIRLLIDAFRLRRESAGETLIHALTEPVGPLAMLLSVLFGTPYVISVHGTYADRRAYPVFLRWLYQAAFRRASAVLPVSRYTADVVCRSFGDVRMEVIPGGFSPPAVSTAKTGPSFERRILSVGALKPRKGFHTLVAALALLKQANERFTCDIIGPTEHSEYEHGLRAAIDRAGLKNDVRIHGRVDDAMLEKFYAQADLFVLVPEHVGPGFEGLGLVYLEALAHSTPAIGGLDCGAGEVIADGVNGFLVPPADPEALAAALRKIFETETWKRMSAAAPGSVSDFAWDRVGAKMNALHQKILNDRYGRQTA